MRRVEGIAPGREYTVSIGGDSGEPVQVTLRSPTEAIRREISVAGLGNESAALAWLAQTREAIRQCLVRVDGYVGADGLAIDTAARFIEHAEESIYLAVARRILDRTALPESDAGPLGGSSSSVPLGTQRSAGTA